MGKFLVVMGALVALSSAAPQLLYGGYPYAAYPSSLTYTHAVPTTVKKTLTYKTAAFEPVDAATPADAQTRQVCHQDCGCPCPLLCWPPLPWTPPLRRTPCRCPRCWGCCGGIELQAALRSN